MSYFARSDELPGWAAHVPAGWRTDWLKWSVELSTKRPTESEQETLPYISNEDIASWTGKLLVEEPKPADADGRLFKKDDVLFNKLRPYLAKVYHTTFDGVSSGELLCLRPSGTIDPRFFFYFLVSKGFIDTINSDTFGSKMPRADWEIVGHQPLPLPPLEAQRRIARFLDEKTARIDGLIEKKRALLERLAERRQALITRAVHKGINPDASMKPSGIGWLGDIPAHWKVQRLRFSVKKFEQGWSPQCDNRPAQPGEWGVLKVGCVNGEFYDEGENKVLPSELDPVERYEVMVGDILVSRANTKELLGSAALVESTQGNMIFSDKLYRITLRDHLDPRYLIGVLRSPLSRLQYEQDATGTSGSMQNIGQDTIKNLVHPLPPYPEQIQIGERLTTMRTEETALRDQVSLSLSRMHEYRSALITSAVTGRIGELQ